ncbi:MFS transporter [Mycobacterium sherrisii]|nr:MFS transporter [Mycobacterium sherrisii]
MTVARRPWLMVFGAIFVSCWGGNQFSPLLLMYEQRAHYSSLVVNALLGIYVLGLIPALLVAGRLSDRLGRKTLMLVGVLSTVAGSTLLTLGGVPLLAAGRLLSGVGVGIAMAVGASWLTELSRPPYDLRAGEGAGARRTVVVFGCGSATGALVAGCIAQWGPLPETLPFLIHIGCAAPFVYITARAPETRPKAATDIPLIAQLKIPGVGHGRFRRIILISAPWLFASAVIGYGYLPTQLAAAGSFGLVFATTASIIALATSALVQPFARRVHCQHCARGLIVATALLAGGLGLVTLSIAVQSIWLGIASSLVLEVGIGIGQVSGLLEVQRIATDDDLAGLTGVFYSLAYAGFLLPTAIAALAGLVPVIAVLWSIAGLAGFTCLLLALASRKHLPAPAPHGAAAAAIISA